MNVLHGQAQVSEFQCVYRPHLTDDIEDALQQVRKRQPRRILCRGKQHWRAQTHSVPWLFSPRIVIIRKRKPCCRREIARCHFKFQSIQSMQVVRFRLIVLVAVDMVALHVLK